jgi:enolase-phosphatase E1
MPGIPFSEIPFSEIPIPTLSFSGKGILLDIEGTTSSVSFVYDEMFPFVRRELVGFLYREWDHPDVRLACGQIARDAGHTSVEAWCGESATAADQRAAVSAEVIRLMDNDVKATGLKSLQGLIWQSGFESGELQAHVYDDVAPAIKTWNIAGRDVRIYSSGSVNAQRLFFGHTICGDLLDQFQGHYDTTTGPKQEADSYRKIAHAYGFTASEILFLSDVPAELNAARTAGMRTGLCVRPGNAEVSNASGHEQITDFTQIKLI